MRTCPRCDKAMTAKVVDDVTVDSCSKCARIFLDCGELGVLSKLRPDIEEKLRGSMTHHATGDKCPECSHQMIEGRFEYMLVERCENCCGMFLPEGTLSTAMHAKPIFDYHPHHKKDDGYF